MSGIKAVMFDMDGVLFDSMPLHTVSWHKAMLGLGVDLPLDVFYMNEGRTCRGTMDILFPEYLGRTASDEECEELYRIKSRYFHSIGEAPPMNGAREVLQKVHDLGLTALVITGSGDRNLMGRLSGAYEGLLRLDLTVCSLDVRKCKPDPEPYLVGLQHAGVSASEALVIENAPLGVRAGHASGCRTIAVNTGPLPDSALLDEGADVLFHSMRELAENFEKLLF